MKQIDVTINEETGDAEWHVQGMEGLSCDQVLAMLEELQGDPDEIRRTPEYYQRQGASKGAAAGGRR